MRLVFELLLPAIAGALALFGLFYAPRLNRLILLAVLLVAGGLVIVALVYMARHSWYLWLRF
jgi:glucan phosphoethanolaminetransferase (alkaline phosphatase superfamily)